MCDHCPQFHPRPWQRHESVLHNSKQMLTDYNSYLDKAGWMGYLGLRFSGLTQGKDGINSLAGQWAEPGSLLRLGNGEGESSSLVNGWGEGLWPLPPWTGDLQRCSALMWQSSSPNRVLRQLWRTGLPTPCSRGTLLCWERLMPSPCSASSASII